MLNISKLLLKGFTFDKHSKRKSNSPIVTFSMQKNKFELQFQQTYHCNREGKGKHAQKDCWQPSVETIKQSSFVLKTGYYKMGSFLDSLYGVVFFQNMTNDSEKHLNQSLEQTDFRKQGSSTAVHSSNDAVKTFGEHQSSNRETLYINKWEREMRQDTLKGAIISSVFIIFTTHLSQAKINTQRQIHFQKGWSSPVLSPMCYSILIPNRDYKFTNISLKGNIYVFNFPCLNQVKLFFKID